MTPRDRRALLVGGSVIVGAVLALRVLPWVVRSVSALQAEAAERVETMARAQEVLAGAGATRDSLAGALGQVIALAPRLVDGRTPADAQASLSGVVSLAASRHGLKLGRLDPLPDSAAGAFVRVALWGEFEGDVAGLTRFLKAIESGDPVLTIPSLSVQAVEPAANTRAAERLRIEASVAGLYLPGRDK